jgi:hypothetical protein
MLQYIRTGLHYAIVKVRGKLVRRELKMDVYYKARLGPGDFRAAARGLVAVPASCD